MVHERPDLSNVEKLFLLNSAVEGSAKKKVRRLEFTETNYQSAWDLLVRSYENKKLLMSASLTLLISLPKMHEQDHAKLTDTVDDTLQYVASLKGLGLIVPSEIVVQALENSLDPVTLSEWKKVAPREEFASVEQIIDFLYREAVVISESPTQKRGHETKGKAFQTPET